MPDREKVIKGIEHCIGDDCNGDKWSECEYSGHGCIDALLKDALALLKAQEPADAIPVEWLMKVLAEANEFPISERETIVAIPYLVKRWQKKQEAR